MLSLQKARFMLDLMSLNSVLQVKNVLYNFCFNIRWIKKIKIQFRIPFEFRLHLPLFFLRTYLNRNILFCFVYFCLCLCIVSILLPLFHNLVNLLGAGDGDRLHPFHIHVPRLILPQLQVRGTLVQEIHHVLIVYLQVGHLQIHRFKGLYSITQFQGTEWKVQFMIGNL